MRSPTENFLSAKALGLTDNERNALVDVLGMLERGEVKHYTGEFDEELGADEGQYDPGCDYFNMAVWSSVQHHFNMAVWSSVQSDCGTVHCIGGLAQAICRAEYKDDTGFTDESPSARTTGRGMSLGNLFYPVSSISGIIPLDSITVEEAASALRNYLTTGAADSDGVLEPS
jgi:hypothetical protein